MKKLSRGQLINRICVYLLLSAVFSLFIFSPGGGYSTEAITNTDTTSYVSVGEIYDTTTNSVVIDNYNILLKYITGNANADIDTVTTKATEITDASEMRAFTISAGTQGDTSYVAKENGKDICVRLGGLDWQVMYLSTDKSGNPILTLWLDNNVQDAWTGRSATEGEYYGFIAKGLYSVFSTRCYLDLGDYPTNMYGTSYVNVVTLNNGGYYTTSNTEVVEFQQSSSSVFADFTMGNGLSRHIVTPGNVTWQEFQGNGVNESWTLDQSYYSNNTSKAYARCDMYDAWKDSRLWIPSRTEIGYNSTQIGLWCTSNAQRMNYDGSTTSLSEKIGSVSSRAATTYTMTRTAGVDGRKCDSPYYPINVSGTATATNYETYDVSAIRPALHLNLKSIVGGDDSEEIEQEAMGVVVGETYNTSTKAIDKNNIKILMKYITGDASATSSTVSTKATEITDASEIRSYAISAGTEGGVAYDAKTAGQDVTVKLGGIDWTALYLSKDKSGNSILTLWMTGFRQSSWASRSATEGTYYGFSDGIMYSDYSANWRDSSQGNYPSNMYGTSYINAVTLNNGGSYATSNSAVTTATQSSSSVFAPYTMSSYGLTQYLVKPRNVAWQENQSAKSVEGVSFNYPNDAWSTSTINDGFFNTANGVSNYASKASSDKWADSYLWLPSATEIGYSNDALGIWKSSQSQRGNYGAVEDEVIGSNAGVTFASSWLRSGHFMDDPSFAYSTNPNGTDMLVNIVSESRVVRPCLHLNLTAIMQAASIASVSEVEQTDDVQPIIENIPNNVALPVVIEPINYTKKEKIYF